MGSKVVCMCMISISPATWTGEGIDDDGLSDSFKRMADTRLVMYICC